MTQRLVRCSAFVAAIGCVLVGGASACAQDADILGSWDVTVNSGQGSDTSAPLLLKKEGDQIVGTFSSPQGEQAVEASVKEKAVTIWFSVRTQNGPINITMNGTAEGDTMKGSMDFGGGGHGQWRARRAPAAVGAAQTADRRTDVTGTWNFEVPTGDTTATPTMTFKQDGQKLSGQYTGQLGELPVTGTIKGDAVEFALDATIQGAAVHIVYSGTVEKDSMKGTVKLGNLGDTTFTAKKKP